MIRFHVVLTEHALGDLKKIAKDMRTQIHTDINALESVPFPSGTNIKRLKGFRPPVYRLRSGDFRVLYHVQGDDVIILRVVDRKFLERVLKRLRI